MAERSFLAAYLPVIAAIGAAYLVTGAALAALPLYLNRDLGFGEGIVGAAAGLQFLFILLARLVGGRLCDRLGPKRVIVAGLLLTTAAGLAYLLAANVTAPGLLLGAIFAGRALSGVGEAFVIIAGQTWGIALLGRDRSAAAIGWAGTALFLGLALGGPLGGGVHEVGGFAAVALLTAGVPLVALFPLWASPGIRPVADRKAPAGKVILAVMAPGLAMCLAGFSFSALSFFSVLLALERSWQPSWGLFSAFALGLVAMRLRFGTLPDRLGGGRTALISFVALALALAGMVAAPTGAIGLAFALCCGASYAFIYPALGSVAVRALPAAQAGSALALYSAFNDLSLALSNPLLGLVAQRVGVWAVFVTAAVAALGGLALTALLMVRSAKAAGDAK